jgi:hypothetical protein
MMLQRANVLLALSANTQKVAMARIVSPALSTRNVLVTISRSKLTEATGAQINRV